MPYKMKANVYEDLPAILNTFFLEAFKGREIIPIGSFKIELKFRYDGENFIFGDYLFHKVLAHNMVCDREDDNGCSN